MVIDTETCNNNLPDKLVYDFGFSIIDTKGTVFEEHSYVIYDVFYGMKDIMASMHLSKRISNYKNDLKAGTRTIISIHRLQKVIWDIIDTYNITAIVGHNAAYDIYALNKTYRYLTQSKIRYFFPSQIEIWDSAKMARSVILKMKTYQNFCHSYNYLTTYKRCRYNAETLYRFIAKDPTFKESHTALEDVKIECEIIWYCYRQKRPMEKLLYEKRLPT